MGNKGGIVSNVLSSLGTTENSGNGGKSYVDVSNNCNTGKLETSGSGNIYTSGVVAFFSVDNSNADKCFTNVVVFNNFNAGEIKSTTTGSSRLGGVIAWFNIQNINANLSNNVKVNIKNCYNYSTALSGGDVGYRGGVVGYFNGFARNINLFSSYSAFKRPDDNNSHGNNTTNPATNGANVGEEINAKYLH